VPDWLAGGGRAGLSRCLSPTAQRLQNPSRPFAAVLSPSMGFASFFRKPEKFITNLSHRAPTIFFVNFMSRSEFLFKGLEAISNAPHFSDVSVEMERS
jgi:hypothetical protein